MSKQTIGRDGIRPFLYGCLCSLVTFVVAIALAVLAGIKFGAVTGVKLLPSLALLLATLAFILGDRRVATAHRARQNPDAGV